jgi:hypothetical protein
MPFFHKESTNCYKLHDVIRRIEAILPDHLTEKQRACLMKVESWSVSGTTSTMAAALRNFEKN